MTRFRFLVLVIVLAVSTVTGAQTLEYERVLVPVFVRLLQGGFGSIWHSELWLFMDRDIPFVVGPFPESGLPPMPTLPPPGRRTFSRSVVASRAGQPVGAILYAQKEFAHRLTGSLRVIEQSGVDQRTTGIPLVKESEFVTGTTHFLHLTTDPLSRIMLRIYNMDRVPATFEVRMVEEGSNEVNTSSDFTLIRSEETGDVGGQSVPSRPSSVEINVLDHFPTLGPTRTVRLEIRPYIEGLRYWAFISVTDNRTQDVQIITPEP